MKTIGVEIEKAGKIFYFTVENDIDLNLGDYCVVNTTRGEELSKVVKVIEDESAVVNGLVNEVSFLKKPSEKEMDSFNELNKKTGEYKRKIQKTAKDLKLEIKILSIQFTFDRKKMLITFSAAQRVDFRTFVKKLASEYKMKIELKQVGERDETKVVGGIGPCGRVCCCNCHLRDFEKVAIKMAKNQNLSLNPTKINGLCGKLMCCLAYENDTYEVLGKKMPRVGSKVITEFGEGTVMYNDILRQMSTIKILENEEYKVIPISELNLGDKVGKN